MNLLIGRKDRLLYLAAGINGTEPGPLAKAEKYFVYVVKIIVLD